MGLPKEKYIELPLLYEIQQRGGAARPKNLYDSVSHHFPGITQDDLQLVNVSDGSSKWTNRVQFVRQGLVEKGEIDRLVFGEWRITQKGRERLAREWPNWSADKVEYSERLYTDRRRTKGQKEAGVKTTPQIASTQVITPTAQSTPSTIAERLRQRLEALNPHQFELFVGKYLGEKGLQQVQVTGHSRDGGIDGNAIQPFLDIKVAFQAKKWGQAQTIGASPIRELLGSITNRGADRGIFITTASFSAGGREEAELSQGRIILIDGQRLAQDCVDMQLGIKPVTTEAAVDEAFFNAL